MCQKLYNWKWRAVVQSDPTGNHLLLAGTGEREGPVLSGASREDQYQWWRKECGRLSLISSTPLQSSQASGQPPASFSVEQLDSLLVRDNLRTKISFFSWQETRCRSSAGPVPCPSTWWVSCIATRAPSSLPWCRPSRPSSCWPGQPSWPPSPWCGTSPSTLPYTGSRPAPPSPSSSPWPRTGWGCVSLHDQIMTWLNLSSSDLVLNAVNTALAQFPDAWLYAVILASLSSSGFVVVKYVEHILLTGLKKPFTIPHHSTKTMFLGACFLVAQHQGVLAVNRSDLFTGLVLSAFILRISTTYFLAMKVIESHI